jgi:hypothetical protein
MPGLVILIRREYDDTGWIWSDMIGGIADEEHEELDFSFLRSGMIATDTLNTHGVVCVKESRVKVGTYYDVEYDTKSGTGYTLRWNARLVQYPDGEVVSMTEVLGDPPPSETRGLRDRYGRAPRHKLGAWLYEHVAKVE